MPWSDADDVRKAEALAEAEERRVPVLARRVDLDRVLAHPAVQRLARALTGWRHAYRRLRRALHLPT